MFTAGDALSLPPQLISVSLDREATMIDPAFWFSAPGIAVVVLCTAIGAAITARLWLTRTFDPVMPKIIWSLVIVLLPVLGWMLYAGFYRAPGPHGEGEPYYHHLG